MYKAVCCIISILCCLAVIAIIDDSQKMLRRARLPRNSVHVRHTCSAPPPKLAVCSAPEKEDVGEGCPVSPHWRLCHIPDLYMTSQGELMVDPQKFPYTLPYLIEMPHASPVWIKPLLGAFDKIIRVPGFHVIHSRVYPRNYAHSIRDTLSYDLFAFRRFCMSTWDPALIASKLRVIYLDGEVTNSEVYSLHTDQAVEENTFQQNASLRVFENSVVRVFENAVVGHLVACERHYMKPEDWHAMSDFIALRTLGFLPERQDRLVWLANREPGRDREWVDADAEVAPRLQQRGFQVIARNPMGMSLEQQVTAAREASFIVGPHGSNLIPMVFAGAGASVVEVLASDFMSWWYAQQAAFQSARWLSYPNSTELARTMGGGRVKYPVEEMVQTLVNWLEAGQNTSIACQHGGMSLERGSAWRYPDGPVEVQACWPQDLLQ